jgi:hypothetical protein
MNSFWYTVPLDRYVLTIIPLHQPYGVPADSVSVDSSHTFASSMHDCPRPGFPYAPDPI